MLLAALPLVIGIVLVALGVWQIRQPLAHYRSLEATEANLRRYDDWRGGRLDDPGARTGADEMRELLRARIRLWSVVTVIGVVLVVVGFLIR